MLGFMGQYLKLGLGIIGLLCAVAVFLLHVEVESSEVRVDSTSDHRQKKITEI